MATLHQNGSPESSEYSEPKLITWERNDPENPRNWPTWRKILAWLPLIVFLDNAVSFGASGFSPVLSKWTEAFNVSKEIGTLGLSLWVLGLAFGPMFNAPLSEYYGRLPIYVISYGISLPFFVASALAPNVAGFLIVRFLGGLFMSVTIANIGGTIADLYPPHDTGYPVSIWIWAATGGSSLGFFLLSFVAQYRSWPYAFWALLGLCGGAYIVTVASLYVAGGETRHSVLLRRRAARLRKQGLNVEVAEEYRKKPINQIMTVTLTRAFRFLATEPVIQFGALYNGYLYGLSFLLNGAFNLVFGPQGYGLNTEQVGLTFLGIWTGISLGPVVNIYQEHYFQRRIRESSGGNYPEARVRMGKVAALTFPISLFWFAWTNYTSIHPVVPVLATTLFGWSFYTLILMTYTYTEDAYKQYSASALAGIGLVRNLAGAGFPLFGNQMFTNLGYHWAGSLLAFLALVLVPIPFVLERYGERLRRRSPWCRAHMESAEELGEIDDVGEKARVEKNGGSA